MKTKLTITIDKELIKRFKEFCDREGYKVSTKIDKLIEEFLKR